MDVTALSPTLGVAVVDDSGADRLKLEKMIRDWSQKSGREISVRGFAGGEAILNGYLQGRYGIIFLDILMEKMSGIETAKAIRRQDPDVLIVFQTTTQEYVFETFAVHPFEYIVKPCGAERVGEILDEAVRVLEKDGKGAAKEKLYFSVRVSGAPYSIPAGMIVTVLSMGHAVELRLENGSVLTGTMTFREAADTLGADPRFLLCNRGVLINMDHAERIRNDTILMEDGEYYPIRVRGKAQVIRQFNQYQIERLRGRDISRGG